MNKELLDELRKIKKSIQGYRSLPEYLLDGVGAILTVWMRPKELQKPLLPVDVSKYKETVSIPYWVSGLIISVLTYFIGWLTSISLGQPFTSDDIKICLWAAVTGAVSLIANKINIRSFLKTFNDTILDKFLLPGDLKNLHTWLSKSFNIYRPWFTGFVLGPALAWVLIENLKLNYPNPLNPGTIVVLNLSCIQSIWVAYYLFPFYVDLPARLVQYHFNLYKFNPSSSEVLGRLSRLMAFIMYVTLAFIIFLTIGLNFIHVLNQYTAIVFSLMVWMPTIVLYATGQFHISSAIMRAKWDIMNDIQTKIESLYLKTLKTDNAMIKKEMLETIDKMMDSHDRVQSTPNTTLNIRSSLNFLNSLMLPILAFLAANLKMSEVLNFIQELIGK